VIFELGVNEGERRMRNAARRAYHKGLTEGLKAGTGGDAMMGF